MKLPLLSIVIPSYNDKDFMKVCLKSIRESANNLEYEVIVVDNASTDGGPEMLEKEFPWVKVIRNTENKYFSTADNQGFRAATGKYCMTLNSDTEIRDNALEMMVEYLEQHLDVGLVSCQLYYPDGSKQINCWKYRNLPGIIYNSQLFNLLGKIAPGIYDRIYRNQRYMDIPDDIRVVDNIMGACMMGPTELINKVGGFDDDIKMGYTDDVLCIKIRRQNYKIVHMSRGYIIHHELKQFKRSAKSIEVKRRDLMLYARRYVGWYAPLVLSPMNFVSRLVTRS